MASISRSVGASITWLALAAGAAAMLATGRDPTLLVFAGALVAFLEPERAQGGWSGFASASMIRLGDALVVASLAWYLADRQATARGAVTAGAVLALALLASYVGVRALSLGIDAPGARSALIAERGVWLALLATGTWAGIPDDPEVLVGALVGAGAWSAVLAAIRAGSIWRSAPRG